MLGELVMEQPPKVSSPSASHQNCKLHHCSLAKTLSPNYLCPKCREERKSAFGSPEAEVIRSDVSCEGKDAPKRKG
jgi:hypothetical protein